MFNHGLIMSKDSSFISLVNPQDPTISFISELMPTTNEMLKYDLHFPNVMNDFLCFYREVLTTVNDMQQKIVLVAHNGTIFDTSFIFKNGILKLLSELNFIFNLGILKFVKLDYQTFMLP